MPLKAAELHRLAREELGPVLMPLGFRRTQNTVTASWVRQERAGWLVIWVQPSRWNDAYSPGFRFTVECALGPEPVIGAGGSRSRLAELLTEAERDELRHLENRTVAKLPPPDRAFAQMMPAEARQRWLAGWDPRREPYRPGEDVWFRHGDADDAQALMDLFKRVLPGAIARFAERAESYTAT